MIPVTAGSVETSFLRIKGEIRKKINVGKKWKEISFGQYVQPSEQINGQNLDCIISFSRYLRFLMSSEIAWLDVELL